MAHQDRERLLDAYTQRMGRREPGGEMQSMQMPSSNMPPAMEPSPGPYATQMPPTMEPTGPAIQAPGALREFVSEQSGMPGAFDFADEALMQGDVGADLRGALSQADATPLGYDFMGEAYSPDNPGSVLMREGDFYVSPLTGFEGSEPVPMMLGEGESPEEALRFASTGEANGVPDDLPLYAQNDPEMDFSSITDAPPTPEYAPMAAPMIPDEPVEAAAEEEPEPKRKKRRGKRGRRARRKRGRR